MIRKVKNWLGIEGVKVSATVAEPFNRKGTKLGGEIGLTSMTDQFIERIKIDVIEKYTRGRRKSKLIDQYTLGTQIIEVNKPIGPEEILTIPFDVEYTYTRSPVENFGNKNFVFSGMAGLAKWVKNAKSEFYVIVEADVKNNALKPFTKVVLES